MIPGIPTVRYDYGRIVLKKLITSVILAVTLVSGLAANGFEASAALTSRDPLVSEQWALSNDGAFSVEVEKNRYAVYDDPFGVPSEPGAWYGRRVLGYVVETGTENATAGVDIGLEQARAIYNGGNRDVIVAVIDTGIDDSHEDLQGALWTNSGEIPGNGIDDDGNGYIDDIHGWNFYNGNNIIYTGSEDSHGTHGAGTIAATSDNGIGISGIVDGNHVKIMALKALGGKNGGGDTTDLIEAIHYAEENGATICNLSLISSSNDPILYEAMANSNMLFICAAGNGDSRGIGVNTDEVPCYPASYDLDNIISVANLSYDGNLHESSNYGSTTVDIAAPGTMILSTTPGNSYGYMTGTSMAAPMVTAAAAMVYSYYDNITLADVKEILLNSVTPVDSLQDITVSGGRLNIANALSYDLSTLSGTGFTNAGRSENGTAPYIESSVNDLFGDSYLTLRIVDIDNDLTTLLYSEGSHTAEEFISGAIQTEPFEIGSGSMVVFKLPVRGTYTFFAMDAKGNATVKVVEFAPISDGPGARNY